MTTLHKRALAAVSALCLAATAWVPGAAAEVRTPFQKYVYKACAPTYPVPNCYVDWGPVPANTRIDVTNVSCHVMSTGGFQPRYLQLTIQRPDGSHRAAPVLVVNYQSNGMWSSNDSLLAYGYAADLFRIILVGFPGQITRLSCNLAGEYVYP